jgi:tungstate transport system substrate-binding protein
MRWVRRLGVVCCCLAAGTSAACTDRAAPRLVLGTTHTVEDSGLLALLTDAFEEDIGDEHALAVVVAGSGEVLAMAARGDIDVVLAHSPEDEIALVAAGRAESRHAVMHNFFVIAGPAADPARIRSAVSAADAFARIEDSAQPFVSRADGSGTHRKESEVWAAAQRVPQWDRYIEAGTGMADALRIASQRNAYVLTDRATYEVLHAELALDILLEDEDRLLNTYSVLVVADARNTAGARRAAEWLRSPDMRRRLASFGVEGTGRALFTVDTTGSDGPRE